MAIENFDVRHIQSYLKEAAHRLRLMFESGETVAKSEVTKVLAELYGLTHHMPVDGVPAPTPNAAEPAPTTPTPTVWVPGLVAPVAPVTANPEQAHVATGEVSIAPAPLSPPAGVQYLAQQGIGSSHQQLADQHLADQTKPA